MKTIKSKAITPFDQPVWCYHCCIRIAPYGLRTVFEGRDYHRDCFLKISHPQAQETLELKPKN
jgi:hypothetical protein